MSQCVPQRYLQGVGIIPVDSCGRIPASPSAQWLSTNNFESVTIATNIDDGSELSKKNIAGEECFYDPACPTKRGFKLTLKECTGNRQLGVLFEGNTVYLDGGEIVGYGESGIDCQNGVALVMPWISSGSNCGGATPKCTVTVFPFVKGWANRAEVTVDGTNLAAAEWAGEAIGSTGDLFYNWPVALPTALSFLDTPAIRAAVAEGKFKYDFDVDCFDLSLSPDCEIEPLV